MDKDSSKELAEEALFAGEAWFDPIEAGLRGRIRGLIEELEQGRRSSAPLRDTTEPTSPKHSSSSPQPLP